MWLLIHVVVSAEASDWGGYYVGHMTTDVKQDNLNEPPSCMYLKAEGA